MKKTIASIMTAALCLYGCSAEPATSGSQVTAVQTGGMLASGGFAQGAGGFTPGTGGFTPGAGGFTPGTGGFTPGTGGVNNPSTGGINNPSTGGVNNPASGGMEPVGGGMEPVGGGEPSPPGSMDPVIPAVAGECPSFGSGTISYMGLGGITVAAGAKPPGPTAPMVFYWHGTASTSGEYLGMAAAVAQGVMAEGGILVAFQGSTGGDFLSGTSVFGKGDFNITDQMVACAVRDLNVDPRRIYTTGCSAGGLFATAMAAMRSNYIASAAPNSGGMAIQSAFQSDYTPPLMTMHGAPGRDVVVIDFSNSSATADKIFKDRGGFVINCNHGGGHCGAGSLAPDVWNFFKAHPYGTDPEPWAGGLPSGFNPVCMIY